MLILMGYNSAPMQAGNPQIASLGSVTSSLAKYRTRTRMAFGVICATISSSGLPPRQGGPRRGFDAFFRGPLREG